MLDPAQVWPPDYVDIFASRHERRQKMIKNPRMIQAARAYYAQNPHDFIEHWCDTVDPRNVGQGKIARMPFALFRRQHDLVTFLHAGLRAESNMLVEKSRDMGATWICVSFSVWLFLFWDGASIGWGSRKKELVDRIGEMDSIFEKCRAQILGIPPELHPPGFDPDTMMNSMKITNPNTGASISGESGDNIGRGGRKLIYFKDESAHYEHPEAIEAALGDNTRVQVDISSVCGLGTVFHRKREAGVDWEPGRPIVRGRTNVFVMDWRDHPHKTQAWYDERKRDAEENGLLHIFAQEVDRNYAASVSGVIVPAEWVQSAIDAHTKIPGMDEGAWIAGLDVADSEDGDRNALSKRKGVVLRYCDEWGARDTGETARRAVMACTDTRPISIMYDCIGVGSGVKSESNRLVDEKLIPRGVRLVPWDAGSSPLWPEQRVVPKDKDSPLNKDFYGNLKAQGWWLLRLRFERTHNAITKGARYSPDDLISLDSAIPRLRQLQKELSQPTQKPPTGRMKLIIDKKPEGMRSPNLADAVMQAYHPILSGYDSTMSWVG